MHFIFKLCIIQFIEIEWQWLSNITEVFSFNELSDPTDADSDTDNSIITEESDSILGSEGEQSSEKMHF